MKTSIFVLLLLSTTSSFAGLECEVTDTEANLSQSPMVKYVGRSSTFFGYKSKSVEAEVLANADLSGAVIRITSRTAVPKQQVEVYAGKDLMGRIDLKADINGQFVMVGCESPP